MSKQSLVGDAAYHLLAGHQALRYGENRLNLEHPPLVKLVAAVPLLFEEPLAPSVTVDRALEASRRVFDDPRRLHRLRLASHLAVLACFGLPLLWTAYLLGREVAGRRAGVLLALVLGLSMSVLPYLSILQTDAAVTLGVTWTVLAAVRYAKRPGVRRAALLGLGTGMALAAKFSGVLVLPAAAASFVLARDLGWRVRLRDAAVAFALALVLAGATYAVANRRYDDAVGRETITRYCRGEALIVGDRMRSYEPALLAVERVSPGLAQWLTGFVGIRLQNEIGVYPTYAFGELRSKGRWWYFPAVFLVKTPLVVLLALLAAVWAVGRRLSDLRGWRVEGALLGVTVAVYLGVAMTSTYNLGVRHLMPVLPLLYLPAAAWAARRPWRSAVLAGVLALEALALTPLWMSSTNTWWLGRLNPTRFAFSVGDAEYHQNFLVLGAAARRRGIRRLHVAYPAVSEKELLAYLPDAVPADPERPPRPGWYAVSTTLEQYLPAIPRSRGEEVWGYASLSSLARLWGPYRDEIVRRGEDHGYVAGTFHLYHLRE